MFKLLKRFLFSFLSDFRSFFNFRSPRPVSRSIETGFTCKVYFIFKRLFKTLVSVEQGTTQATPISSPDKNYTALQVAAPRTLNRTLPQESPSTPVLQIDEGTTKENSSEPALTEDPPIIREETLRNEESSLLEPDTTQLKIAPTSKPMDEDCHSFAQEFFTDLDAPGTPRILSPRFSQFVTGTDGPLPNPLIPSNPVQEGGMSQQDSWGSITRPATAGNEPVVGSSSSTISITRQEVLFLANFLGKIPQSFITGEEGNLDQPMSVAVVDDITPTTLITTSSQEDMVASVSTGIIQQEAGQSPPTVRGKRRRPKYSLTGSMFKRHPVLKFSATGPLDKDKSPYKWWCRVCRVELSLMSRGSLELISHYSTDSHLVREHRIRMEVPGMPLFDKDEKEILGTSLQDAKKKARDSYPIPPQLDSLRPLVGQESIPDFSATTSPTEKLFSQISILEFGLRHGGSVSLLTGVYEELVRLTSSSRISSQNWSPQRLFVSNISCRFFTLLSLAIVFLSSCNYYFCLR